MLVNKQLTVLRTTKRGALLTQEPEVSMDMSKELATSAEEESEIFSADQQQLFM